MAAVHQIVDPKVLGFMTRVLRTARNMSQEALAAASDLTTRTIQRVEAGERSTIQTRQSLARGLGYDRNDVFDDPEFVATLHSIFQGTAEQQEKEIEANHPDHYQIAVAPIRDGAQLGRLIESAEASLFQSDENLPVEARRIAASVFEALRDWGDIWSDLSETQRIDSEADLAALLKDLSDHGLHAFGTRGVRKFVSQDWEAGKTVPFAIVYFTVVATERSLTHILVPKQTHMA